MPGGTPRANEANLSRGSGACGTVLAQSWLTRVGRPGLGGASGGPNDAQVGAPMKDRETLGQFCLRRVLNLASREGGASPETLAVS